MSYTPRPLATPRDLTQFKIPGYTGHVHGEAEVIARTPVIAQLEAQQPGAASFLSARKASPVPSRSKDAATATAAQLAAGVYKEANLWPCLQATGAQEPAKPATSNLAGRLGDSRINPWQTSYGTQFDAPFETSRKLRSPLRNTALQHVSDLRDVYRSAYSRVGEKRLGDILHHMRERLAGKMGNRNDNAFKLRKLFKMYDPTNSGLVDIEDFRVTTEAFGIQLDDDSLLALYNKFDPQGTGRLHYHAVMRELLDPADYKLYAGGSDPLKGEDAA